MAPKDKPYPEAWEQVADLRVFRTDPAEWEKFIGWRQDMKRHGWKLLKVTNESGELVAVFGKSKIRNAPLTPAP